MMTEEDRARMEGREPHPDSAEYAIEQLRKAWREFVMELGKATRIDRLLGWLSRRLGG